MDQTVTKEQLFVDDNSTMKLVTPGNTINNLHDDLPEGHDDELGLPELSIDDKDSPSDIPDNSGEGSVGEQALDIEGRGEEELKIDTKGLSVENIAYGQEEFSNAIVDEGDVMISGICKEHEDESKVDKIAETDNGHDGGESSISGEPCINSEIVDIEKTNLDESLEEPFQTEETSLFNTWSTKSNEPLSSPPPPHSSSKMQGNVQPSHPGTGESLPATEEKGQESLKSPSGAQNGLLRGWSKDCIEQRGVLKTIRKAGVAVTGGALVVVGLPMIPMPTPGGVVVVGSGMALLATEFPAAQQALDKSRQGLANMVGDESDDDEEKKEKKKKIAKVADLLFEDEKGDKKKRPNELFKQFSKINTPNPGKMFQNDEFKDVKEKTVNAAKKGKKNVKKFIRSTVLPLMERMTSEKKITQIGETAPGNLRPVT